MPSSQQTRHESQHRHLRQNGWWLDTAAGCQSLWYQPHDYKGKITQPSAVDYQNHFEREKKEAREKWWEICWLKWVASVLLGLVVMTYFDLVLLICKFTCWLISNDLYLEVASANLSLELSAVLFFTPFIALRLYLMTKPNR